MKLLDEMKPPERPYDFSLERLTRIALGTFNMETSWSLLELFQHLRPHYFWPILVMVSKKKGERGR